MSSDLSTTNSRNLFLSSLFAGGCAGTAVDVSLYPIDTLKTRLQSPKGFVASGGFKGIYNGLSSVVIGSAPGAALFFCTYESMKKQIHGALQGKGEQKQQARTHMLAASCGETIACLVRVPTEVIKSNLQISSKNTFIGTVGGILRNEGIFGLYRGFGSTIMREIPFSVIQFPLYEQFKVLLAGLMDRELLAVEGAATTPLDVIKTRIMLIKDSKGVKYNGFIDCAKRIYINEGPTTFFSGVAPRTMWISIGGFVFFGVYEYAFKRLKKDVFADE